MASDTAPQPPIGWKTPCSYSRNERIENRLGHLKGDMPRYFDWNVKASRIRSSLKKVPSSASRLRHGLSIGTSLISSGLARSSQLWNGCSRNGANRSNLARVLSMNRVKAPRSADENRETSASIRAMSGVQESSPPAPKIKRYCGSRRTISTSCRSSRPQVWKISSSTRG